MRAEQGKRVTISFVCRHEDGSLHNFTNSNSLSFVVGHKQTPPSIDAGVEGMKVGEQATIRLQARELEEHPLDALGSETTRSAATSRIPSGYEFAPGNDGDIIAPSQPRSRMSKKPLSPDAVLIFHVKMVKIEETRG